eukprot:8892886-Pyramimonas_sp.AAC.1
MPKLYWKSVLKPVGRVKDLHVRSIVWLLNQLRAVRCYLGDTLQAGGHQVVEALEHPPCLGDGCRRLRVEQLFRVCRQLSPRCSNGQRRSR